MNWQNITSRVIDEKSAVRMGFVIRITVDRVNLDLENRSNTDVLPCEYFFTCSSKINDEHEEEEQERRPTA